MPQTLTQRPAAKAAPSSLPGLRSSAGFDFAASLARVCDGAVELQLARLALLDAAIIVALGILGALEFFTTAPLGLFNLDAEGSIPAAFSGALLVCAAMLATAVLYEGGWSRQERRTLSLIAAFLAYMGVDEVVGVHEHVGAILGTHWQIPYLPLAAAAGLVWLAVLRILSADRTAARLWVGGAAVWVGSQVFEAVETVTSPHGYAAVHGAITTHAVLTIPEETGEMLGSSLFLFALIVFVRRSLRSRSVEPQTAVALAGER
jgi:hypothetical protein